MSIIYGKTLMSTAISIQDSLSQFLSYKESFEVAKVCFQFWKKQAEARRSALSVFSLGKPDPVDQGYRLDCIS